MQYQFDNIPGFFSSSLEQSFSSRDNCDVYFHYFFSFWQSKFDNIYYLFYLIMFLSESFNNSQFSIIILPSFFPLLFFIRHLPFACLIEIFIEIFKFWFLGLLVYCYWNYMYWIILFIGVAIFRSKDSLKRYTLIFLLYWSSCFPDPKIIGL